MANGHTRGNSVRVHNQVRGDTFQSEGHILLSIGHPNSTFLSMTRGKLISNLRGAHISNTDFTKLKAIFCCGQHYFIDDAVLV
eukprot:CAMPEP_0117811546 /NCGR_PEP_ID=MMETSP0948-20121206/22202_1 /TAXON_ID=44440 /ORGANISM="Chattonella subsalsa, Strain CCMP2191" /LENGTH=82 /DNA_ID=CAMNT_0005648181 /DNA_START=857 /DNA_END=1105 /DNA_ORIENTATION=+